MGSIKERGSVVEVREDSLVKAFIPSGENKPNGLQNSLVTSASIKLKDLPDNKLESLMGLESLTKQNGNSSESWNLPAAPSATSVPLLKHKLGSCWKHLVS